MVRCREGCVDGNGAACMFPSSRDTYTGSCRSSIWDDPRNSVDVDTDTVLHAIDLRGKVGVNWMRKHALHIVNWGNHLQRCCQAVLGDMPPQHQYLGGSKG